MPMPSALTASNPSSSVKSSPMKIGRSAAAPVLDVAGPAAPVVDVAGPAAPGDWAAGPRQRRALVPVDVGTQLDNLAAVGDPQVLPPPDAVGAGDDRTDVFCGDVAVVHGDGETFV